MIAATVTVSVTQEHIDEGLTNNCARCPVALAAKQAIPGVDMPVVLYSRAMLWMLDGTVQEFEMPDEATHFIDAFDRHGRGSVEPLTFTMTEVTS